MPKYTVTNTILATTGAKLANVQVNIKLMPSGGFLMDTKSEIVRELNVVSDGVGVWTANLESNLNILPSGTWYEVLEKIPKNYGGARTWIIGVENSGGPLYTLVLPEPPPYTDVIYTPPIQVTRTDWADLTLQNGATPFGNPYYKPQFRKFDDMVQLRGLARLGDSLSIWPANQVVANLPVGYRPLGLNRFTSNVVPEGQTVNGYGAIQVDLSGNIFPVRNIVNAHMFLDGLIFATN